MFKEFKGEKVRSLNKEEQQIIKELKELSKRWPKTLWLASMAGTLHVMQRDESGNRVYNKDHSLDAGYAVTQIGIPNDGGDW